MGSSPKAPAALPDPAIAARKARQEAIAIGHAEQSRTKRFGSSSTQVAGTSGVRPDEDIALQDLATTTKVGRVDTELAELGATGIGGSTTALDRLQSQTGLGGQALPGGAKITERVTDRVFGKSSAKKAQERRQAQIGALKGSVTEADRAEFATQSKSNAISSFINKTRKRVGVTSTGGQL